jgi:hypothetical protein
MRTHSALMVFSRVLRSMALYLINAARYSLSVEPSAGSGIQIVYSVADKKHSLAHKFELGTSLESVQGLREQPRKNRSIGLSGSLWSSQSCTRDVRTVQNAPCHRPAGGRPMRDSTLVQAARSYYSRFRNEGRPDLLVSRFTSSVCLQNRMFVAVVR